MRDVARDAAFITAGSAAIADACAARFGARPIAVHNAFELPADAPRWNGRAGGPLRMYWFSQTIGPSRGLEDVVAAAGLVGRSCELHVRGVPAAGYLESLHALVTRLAPSLTLIHHLPIDPDVLVDTCRGFDVGLSPEQMGVPNQELALSNKSLTYPLAGLPVVITDTPGQRELARDLGAGAVCYRPGDVANLASGLARWFDDPEALRAAGAASWEAARRRWHWRHPAERGALVGAVARVVS
jgi:glycosyltransferase involved in cell wall biosynthesis